MTFAPRHDEMRGQRGTHEHSADQDVGVDDQALWLLGLVGMCFARRDDRLVDQCLRLVRRQVGEFAARLGHGLVEHAPFDGVLNEF